VLALIFIVTLYFTPSIVAVARKAPDMGSVIVLNLFLGWTFIGWVLSLAMAARSSGGAAAISVNVQQQLPPQPQVQPGYGYGYGYQQVAGAQPYQLPAQRPGAGHIPTGNGHAPASNGHGQAAPQSGG